MALLDKHKVIETNAIFLLVFSFLVVIIGGIVQIVPLFYLENTIEKVEGVRFYLPLELAGREIYVCEGCYVCHSQMICLMRDEVECYGYYSLVVELMYDRLFQWGSKCMGFDLARVGGCYSDDWHVQHMIELKLVVLESIMLLYGFMMNRVIDGRYIVDLMMVSAMLGVFYIDEMMENAVADFRAQANPDADTSGLLVWYFGAQTRNFDGQPDLTEMDAIIVYMQMFGMLVDFLIFVFDDSC